MSSGHPSTHASLFECSSSSPKARLRSMCASGVVPTPRKTSTPASTKSCRRTSTVPSSRGRERSNPSTSSPMPAESVLVVSDCVIAAPSSHVRSSRPARTSTSCVHWPIHGGAAPPAQGVYPTWASHLVLSLRPHLVELRDFLAGVPRTMIACSVAVLALITTSVSRLGAHPRAESWRVVVVVRR